MKTRLPKWQFLLPPAACLLLVLACHLALAWSLALTLLAFAILWGFMGWALRQIHRKQIHRKL